LVLKLDDQKEITDFEVVSVEKNDDDVDFSNENNSDSDAAECVYFTNHHEELDWF